MSEWNKWNCIKILPEKDEPAIYQIRLNQEFALKHLWYKDGIPRLLGCDPEYILSIGKTKNIQNRISRFKKSFTTGKDKTHSEGRTLYLIKNLINLKDNIKKFDIGLSDVQYRYRTVKESDLSNEEESYFKEYIKKYGEVPPLNGCIPGRKKWIDKKYF